MRPHLSSTYSGWLTTRSPSTPAPRVVLKLQIPLALLKGRPPGQQAPSPFGGLLQSGYGDRQNRRCIYPCGSPGFPSRMTRRRSIAAISSAMKPNRSSDGAF